MSTLTSSTSLESWSLRCSTNPVVEELSPSPLSFPMPTTEFSPSDTPTVPCIQRSTEPTGPGVLCFKYQLHLYHLLMKSEPTLSETDAVLFFSSFQCRHLSSRKCITINHDSEFHKKLYYLYFLNAIPYIMFCTNFLRI